MIIEEGPPEYRPLISDNIPLAGGVHTSLTASDRAFLRGSWLQMPPELKTPLLGLEPAPFTHPKLYVGELAVTLRYSSVKVAGSLGGVFDTTTDTVFDKNGTFLIHEWGHLIDNAWKKRVEGAATRSRISDEPLWVALWTDVKAIAPFNPGPTRQGMQNQREFFAEVLQAWMRRNGDQLLNECSSSLPLTQRAIAMLKNRFPFNGMQVVIDWDFG